MEKQRGKMGMTWGIKLQRFVVAFAVVAALAVASGAFWVESIDWASFSFGW